MGPPSDWRPGLPTQQLASAIHEAVVSRREYIVRLLVDLVSVPSVTFDEGAVQDVVERNYALRGLRIDRWEATRDQIVDYLVHVGEQDTYAVSYTPVSYTH